MYIELNHSTIQDIKKLKLLEEQNKTLDQTSKLETLK